MFERIQELCSRTDAFAPAGATDELFVAAMRENYAFQLERQPYLAHLAAQRGPSAAGLRSLDDVLAIPPLFVGTMKVHAFRSVPESALALTLTSSGTGGQKTQAFFDQGSLDRLLRLSNACFDALGYRDTEPAHAFMMSYDPSRAADVGTTWSDRQMVELSPRLTESWVIEWSPAQSEYQFDAERWAKVFVERARQAPVRLLGFPAFMSELVEEVVRLDPSLRVHPRSRVLAGGGWKNHRGEPMTHRDFARMLEAKIGLPAAQVTDTYGMAEHGVPYCTCEHGHHHVPIFARLAVREPMSLASLPLGEEGLLHLLTPYNTAQASLSVLSTDLVRLGRGCECGRPGDFLASIRRGGVQKHRGCAIAAQEILERSRARKESGVGRRGAPKGVRP
jgi:phenylacetate-coenzyme A ligase PaaK-like adenylate-forming protein